MRMDEDPQLGEQTLLQSLRRRYAYLSAWLVRLNRMPEPSRLPELPSFPDPTQAQCPTKTTAPSARGVRPPRLAGGDLLLEQKSHCSRHLLHRSGVAS